MNIKLETAFYSLGIIQAIQLLLFGWKNRRNTKNTMPFFNGYLVAFIFCIILELITAVIDSEDFFGNFNYLRLVFLIGPVEVLFGPLIYFYILSLSTHPSNRPTVLPHLFMFFIWVLLYLPFVIFIPSTEIMAVLAGQVEASFYFELVLSIMPLLAVIQIAYYVKKSYSHIKAYQDNLSSFYSYQKNISLNWVKRILYSIIVVFLIYLFFDILELPLINYFEIEVVDYALVAWVLYFSYSVIIHKDQKLPVEMIESAEKPEEKKETKSFINPKEVATFEECVLNQELFLDPDLNLAKLSECCNITRHRASLLLNEGVNASFYDYINKLRINYAKELLADSNYTRNILAVAYDSGFKSRSAFYTAFKKWENKTPSQFLKTLKKVA